jgi:glucan phosphoethanolaminetransferase (alkaline phosphatase superfamily)
MATRVLQALRSLARPLFIVAWSCPTLVLLSGDLEPARVFAAVALAVCSGLALASLPARAFRIVRVVTTVLFPLCWLWIGYASLNGTGPSPPDALATLVNTNYPEASTALRLMSSGPSISLGLLQLSLLVLSFIGGSAELLPGSSLILAGAMLMLAILDWTVDPSSARWPLLPSRADWDDFPYGSMVRIAAAAAADPAVLHRQATLVLRPRVPLERHVDRPIDAVFIIGESFRFDGRWAADDNPAWKPLAQRIDAHLGALLPKVCVSADTTAISVPMLMTGVTPVHHLDVPVTPSGLYRLGAAGYSTAWISNQGERLFADEPRNLVWTRNGFGGGIDDDLVPVMAAFLARPDPSNKALVVHLTDSHVDYVSRYKPMPEPANLDREQLELLRYARANDHTLQVLYSVASLLDSQQTPAFAVYVSDHGENLLIDHNGLHFHIGARTSSKAAYVPSIVLWNSAFLQDEDAMQRLQPLRSPSSLGHGDIYHLWMNFAGVEDAPLTPTPDPKILGKVKLTDTRGPVSCTRLDP